MEQQESYLPDNMGGSATPGVQTSAAVYELRPLTLGEILDRTFSIYRSNFKLFAGLSALAASIELVMNLIQLALPHSVRNQTPQLTTSLISGAFAIVAGLLLIFAVNVIQAATVFALGETYLGRPITIAESVRATISRWYRYIGISIWQIASFAWVPVLLVVPGILLMVVMKSSGLAILGGVLMVVGILAGYVIGFILYLRNSLGVQTAVIENLAVRQAMRRSKVLAAGAKGRIFVVELISGVLYLVVAVFQAPLLFLIGMAAKQGTQAIGAHAGVLLVSFAGRTLVGPVIMIGLSLVYFDQRVRKEAFDLVMLMGGAAPAGDASADFWSTVAASSGEVPAAVPAPATEPGPAEQSASRTEGDSGPASDIPVV